MGDSGRGKVIRVIEEALVQRQGLPADAAREIVEELSKQPDVMAAAEEWARFGAYPDHPMIEGFTPSTVAGSFAELRPSQVFTMLCALRDDPETVVRWMRYDRRSPFDADRLVEDAVAAGATFPSPSTAEIDEGYGTELFILTDEELEIIDRRARDERLVVTPHLDRFDDQVKNLVVATAFRGLVARNMVRPPSSEALEAVRRAPKEAAPVDVELAPVIAALIQVRSEAPVVVCAHRTREGGREYAYWYLLEGGTAVEELVEGDGMHRFRGLETKLVDAVVYGFVNPKRVLGQVGQDRVVPYEGQAGSTPAVVLGEVAGTSSIAEFGVRVMRQPADHLRVVAVASSGQKLLMAETEPGSPELVRVHEVGADALYEAIKANVVAGLAHLAPAGPEEGGQARDATSPA